MDTPEFDESGDGELEELLRRVANAPPRRPPPLPAQGDLWGRRRRYRIDHCLGKGGMGAVYLAYDLLLHRPVALKVLHRTSDLADADDRGRLLREARAAARVEHDRVARVYDVGEHDDVPFVAMEYIRGVTLRRWMQQRVAEPGEIASIGLQIAEGLDALHTNGIVHRDLKPENVMLSETGGIKLLDLGLAKRSMTLEGDDTERASVGLRVGTPGYMAPEQYGGSTVDARADVFAMGVLIYELVTGERPFGGASSIDLARATVCDTPSFASERWRAVPATLRWIVEQALNKEPSRRPRTSREILDAFATLMPPTSIRPISSALIATLDLERASTVAIASGPPASPSRPSVFARVGNRRAWLAIATIGVLPLLVSDARAPEAKAEAVEPPWAPAGMVVFPGGHVRLGRTRAELDAECAHLGSPCPADLMAIETPTAEGNVAPFAIEANEVTVADFTGLLVNLGSQLRVDRDPDESDARRYVRFASGVHAGELVADLWHGESGILYGPAGYTVRDGTASLPVRLVSWLGANLYCRFRATRLPTEAEWEIAAHGFTQRRFPWGDVPPTCGAVVVASDGLVPVTPREGCSGAPGGPVAVGVSTQDVTPEGVHDLGGNVTEWTDTKIAKLAIALASPPSGDGGAADVDDPVAVRGGSYAESFLARTTARARAMRGGALADLGFRCAVSMPGK